MKKQILFILACISLILVAQTPQRFPGGVISSKYVVTNSTNDSVLLGAGGRKAVNSIVTDTSKLSARINAKEPLIVAKGTAFNKNFGTNTGTVMEGRYLGTAANLDITDVVGVTGDQSITGEKQWNGGASFSRGAIFYGQRTPFVTGVGTYVANYVSPTYGARILAYDGTNYQPLYLGKLISGSTFQLELSSGGSSTFGGNLTAANLSGTNTGDETLTSIKTKLGAASASNSGYLTNNDWSTFNNKQFALYNPAGSGFVKVTGSTVTYDNNTYVSFPGFGTTTGRAWGYDSHPTTIVGYGITDAVGASGLSTNYIPKWNGSLFVNSAFRNDASNSFVDLKTTITGASGGDVLVLNKASGAGNLAFYNDGVYGGQIDCSSGVMNLYSNYVKVQSTTQSTAPTTGALVVDGGIGVGGSVKSGNEISANLDGSNTVGAGSRLSLYNSAGSIANSFQLNADYGVDLWNYSGLGWQKRMSISKLGEATFASTVTASGFKTPTGTSAQLLSAGGDVVALTTNGSSGAATLSSGVLNIPQYTANVASGSFSCAITAITGVSSASVYASYYTRVGSMIIITINGSVTTSASGTCSFKVTTPVGSAYPGANLVINMMGSTAITAWVSEAQSDYAIISFTSPGSGVVCGFKSIGMGY